MPCVYFLSFFLSYFYQTLNADDHFIQSVSLSTGEIVPFPLKQERYDGDEVYLLLH
jgi:hypothetical protein